MKANINSQVIEASEIPQVEDKHIYYTKFAKDYVAVHMLFFGHRFFNEAVTEEKIKTLIDVTMMLGKRKPFAEMPGLMERIGDVMLNSLLDQIKICICFENYFKVKLLMGGFIIHKIKDRDILSKALLKRQKIEPISALEVFPNNEILQLNHLDERLQANTLDFNRLLQPGYAKYLGMDKEIIDFLMQMARQRNRLHLYHSAQIVVSDSDIELLQRLKMIVNCEIAILHNTLSDGIGRTTNRLKPTCQ